MLLTYGTLHFLLYATAVAKRQSGEHAECTRQRRRRRQSEVERRRERERVARKLSILHQFNTKSVAMHMASYSLLLRLRHFSGNVRTMRALHRRKCACMRAAFYLFRQGAQARCFAAAKRSPLLSLSRESSHLFRLFRRVLLVFLCHFSVAPIYLCAALCRKEKGCLINNHHWHIRRTMFTAAR